MSKRVVVTGAASGIGAASAEELRSRGARVIGLDVRPDPDAGVLECDVRDQDSVDRAMAEAIERLGGVDVLINNAGLGTPQSAGARPDAGALAVLDVNLVGPWRVTAAALPELRASRGRVVNVASGLAVVTIPFAPAYCMSKHGLVAYSDSLRLEHGDAIHVTTVYPGYVRTPIHAESKAQGLGLEGTIPPESLGQVARTVARAALGRPVRDLATTRRGTISYALARRSPRRVVDAVIAARIERLARQGRFESTGLAGEYVARLTGSGSRATRA
ncbi:MAG TPA: SDR family NAD(P)-dependent oxidoreductase [Thermoleophilaceae bacterium]